MKVFADLHLHSRYSAATSERMTVTELSRFAEVKGLNMLGTGDALHPSWFDELKRSLVEAPEKGLYIPAQGSGKVYFIAQTEVATIHELEGKSRRIHHVILMPSLDVAEQLGVRLEAYGDIESDGRPVLDMSPAELVETVMEISEDNFLFPAHAWTPWYSIFGAVSGVDSMEQCYEDQVGHVYALETGLSSDPPMNWRVSSLDGYALVSASDSHSPWPFRLGREACVFNLEAVNYNALVSCIREKDPKRFLMTVEVDPAYGKGLRL